MIDEHFDPAELFDEFYLIDEPLTSRPPAPVVQAAQPVVQETAEIPVDLPAEAPVPVKISFEGGNKNGLVFIYNKPLTPADQDMLQKLIHNAMKLTMEDIALIGLGNNAGLSFENIAAQVLVKHAIIWGAQEWIVASAPATLYDITSIGAAKVLMVDAVDAFHNNIPLKTTLWNGIQQLLKS